VYRLCSNIYYITISSMSPNLVYRLCSNIYYITTGISSMSPNTVYRLCSYIYYITVSLIVQIQQIQSLTMIFERNQKC